MDPITHLTTGALGGQAVRGVSGSRAAIAGLMIAAAIPDLDNFVGLANPELYLIHHRGITHSLLGGFLIALVLALLFRLASPALSFARWLLFSYAAIAGHIFLDLVTSYGTQVFLPFSRYRYSVQCVFIIDPVFTLSLAALLLWSLRRPARRRLVALLGLSWMVLYPGLNLGIRQVLQGRLERQLDEAGTRFTRLELSPDAFAPFFWKLILDDGMTYRMASVSLLDPGQPPDFRIFRKANLDLMEQLGRRVSMFRTYAWFAVYPVMEESSTPAGRRVSFGDLRFHHAVPFGGEWLRREESVAFQLTALLDASGNLSGWEYNQPRGHRYIQHLE